MTATVETQLQPPAPPTPARRIAGLLEGEITAGWVVIILVGHGFYGILLARSAALATLHALLTFGLGLWIAMTSTMRRVALVCAYIGGSEILWRIGKAAVPWEYVKYATVVLLVITLARVRKLRWDWLAVTYFALLIPSTLMSFSEQPFEFARQQISFNLSGPLLLAAATWFFAYLRPSRADIQRLFLAILAPVSSLALIALTKTASLDNLTFSDASNFQTSAGYGPNQVSTVLGLGVLLALLLALLIESGIRSRLTYGAVALILGVMSALTFSRGGLFGALGAIAIASPFLVQGARSRIALVIGAVALVGTVQAVILPRLDALTEGELSVRFEDVDPTGRDVLVKTELETFVQHPFLGIGPASLVQFGGELTAVHTEFSRLPAQHGIFGVFALAVMGLLAWRATIRQRNAAARALTVALLAWSLLTMGHAAMRLAVTPLAFGMAAALFLVERSADETPAARGRQR